MLKFWVTNILFAAGLFLFFFFKPSLHLSYWYLLAWTALFMTVQFMGAYFIGLNFHVQSQNHLKTSEKIVALTFDDGPHNPNTAMVLEVLKKHGIKAVFFCDREEHPGERKHYKADRGRRPPPGQSQLLARFLV